MEYESTEKLVSHLGGARGSAQPSSGDRSVWSDVWSDGWLPKPWDGLNGLELSDLPLINPLHTGGPEGPPAAHELVIKMIS